MKETEFEDFWCALFYCHNSNRTTEPLDHLLAAMIPVSSALHKLQG